MTHRRKPPARIAPARVAAFEALRAVHSGRVDLGSALARARQHLDDERDRALAGEIATGALRWRAALDHVIAASASRPLHKLDPEVLDILRLTVFQLLHLDRIPASAAVKDAVDLTGKAGKRSAAGLVNAVLRRVSRERDRLPLPERPGRDDDREAALAYLSTTLSHPRWLAERWLDRCGLDDAEAWMRFNNAPAPLTLRANTLKTTTSALAEALSAQGVETEPARFAPDALVVRSGNPLRTPLDEQGLFVIQDEASQLVALFANPQPGELVLDACASPGGKTTAMAARLEGRGTIVATDVRPRRTSLLARTVARSGARNVRVLQADVAKQLPFAPVFDRILLDAPCSGLGTIRRDPDIRWRRAPEDFGALAAAQLEMLRHAAAVLRPGGSLVYATCSSEPEENDGVVDAFCREHPQFAVARGSHSASGIPHPAVSRFVDPDGRFRTVPPRDGLEAFFAVILR